MEILIFWICALPLEFEKDNMPQRESSPTRLSRNLRGSFQPRIVCPCTLRDFLIIPLLVSFVVSLCSFFIFPFFFVISLRGCTS